MFFVHHILYISFFIHSLSNAAKHLKYDVSNAKLNAIGGLQEWSKLVDHRKTTKWKKDLKKANKCKNYLKKNKTNRKSCHVI